MDDTIDLNNNASEEKSYSLRPRSLIKCNRDYEQDEEPWKPRGRTKKRSKQKSAPLSKYRRKTANARERSRMREINEAFEALRRAVPHLNSTSDNPGEKISKIMTLRLAMKYITALSSALQEPTFGECSLRDFDFTCERGLTPTSLSDHSDFGDDFFTATLHSESLSSTSPSYDVPDLATPPLGESLNLPPFHHLRSDPLATASPQTCSSSTSTDLLVHPLSSSASVSDKSSRCLTQSHHPPLHLPPQLPLPLPQLSSRCDLRSHTLTPPEDVSKSFSSYHFKENSLPSTFSSNVSFLSADFDGLPSPAMDFEDLFIK